MIFKDNTPFDYFDAIYCINLDRETVRWQTAFAQFKALGISHKVRQLSAVETPGNHHVGCALSHRASIQHGRDQNLQNILVLEDDVIFRKDTLEKLGISLNEIHNKHWNVLYLGGHCWGVDYTKSESCEALLEVGLSENESYGPTCTHAIAYHQSCFDYLLRSLPHSKELMINHLQKNMPAIDQLLAVDSSLKRLITHPRVASQPPLLSQEDSDFSPL